MYNITITYHGELNFFLPRNQRDCEVSLSFHGRRSVEDLIESMGVPHVEVDVIIVNGVSVDFSCIVKDGDIADIYPDMEFSETPGVVRLRLSSLIDTKFVLDVHLGKLARSLRLLGFDVDYADNRDDKLLADIANLNNRILLTCDRQLLMRKIVPRGIIIRSRDPDVQIIEVITRLHLRDLIRPFTRCIVCNGTIEKIDIRNPDFKTEMENIPSGVISWCDEFFFCTSCRKVYWKGSHYDRLSVKLGKVMRGISPAPSVRPLTPP